LTLLGLVPLLSHTGRRILALFGRCRLAIGICRRIFVVVLIVRIYRVTTMTNVTLCLRLLCASTGVGTAATAGIIGVFVFVFVEFVYRTALSLFLGIMRIVVLFFVLHISSCLLNNEIDYSSIFIIGYFLKDYMHVRCQER